MGVCFEEQGTDTSELAGEFLTAIFAMMDQKESENISDNIRWSIQKRMARGTFISSSIPFGYKKDGNGKTIIDDERAKYVQKNLCRLSERKEYRRNRKRSARTTGNRSCAATLPVDSTCSCTNPKK